MSFFNSEEIFREHIIDSKLRGYLIGFEQGEFRLKPMTKQIIDAIPDFVYGVNEPRLNITNAVEKLREAAETIYNTDKYQKRGEFGDIILHILLRDFFDTQPLISKIYFKDGSNEIVKGFDGVHVRNNNSKREIYLGEAKIYKEQGAALNSLLKDLDNHFSSDYLRREFLFISRKVPNNYSERQSWLQLISKKRRLEDIFSSMIAVMVCTYESSIYSKHEDETDSFIKDFESEIKKLGKKFTEGMQNKSFKIILLLIPIKKKEDLIEALNTKLTNMRRL